MIDIINGLLIDLGIIGTDTLTVNHILLIVVLVLILTFISDIVEGITKPFRKV